MGLPVLSVCTVGQILGFFESPRASPSFFFFKKKARSFVVFAMQYLNFLSSLKPFGHTTPKRAEHNFQDDAHAVEPG